MGTGYKYSGGDQLNKIAWYNENSGGTSHEVGLKESVEAEGGIGNMTAAEFPIVVMTCQICVTVVWD